MERGRKMGWFRNEQWRDVIHEHYDAWMLASGEVYWRCTEWQDPDYDCGTRDEVLREAKEYKLLYVTYTVMEKIDKNTDLDSMPLWELAEEVTALKNGTWEVTPESLMRKLRKACGLMNQVFNKGVVSEKPGDADSNMPTADELPEEVVTAPGGNGAPPQLKTPTEKRDEWLYAESLKGTAYDSLVRKLAKKPVTWPRIETAQGIRAAILRYAKRHDLPLPPTRQRGRPPRSKN